MQDDWLFLPVFHTVQEYNIRSLEIFQLKLELRAKITVPPSSIPNIKHILFFAYRNPRAYLICTILSIYDIL